jgi:hypothetical protein
MSSVPHDMQLKRDIMTYYEYNDFLATYILNLFPFDEAVEFIQVLNTRPGCICANAGKQCRGHAPTCGMAHSPPYRTKYEGELDGDRTNTCVCRRTRRSGQSRCALTRCGRGGEMWPER